MSLPAKRTLPSLTDLYSNVQVIDKQNQLNILLNADPKPEWIKIHPMAAGVKYIPIGIVEWLLTNIFIKWRVEIKDTKIIANSVCVTVRLHYQDPVSMEWDWQDGIGSAPIQTKKGAAATDFTQVLTDAVTKAAPSAESYAVKDASEKIGRIFGKDLNRKEWMPYTGLDGKIDLDAIECDPAQMRELYDLLAAANLSHVEVDDFREKFAQGVSIEAYQLYRRELTDLYISPLDKIRNGHNVSQGEIKEAIKTITT